MLWRTLVQVLYVIQWLWGLGVCDVITCVLRAAMQYCVGDHGNGRGCSVAQASCQVSCLQIMVRTKMQFVSFNVKLNWKKQKK